MISEKNIFSLEVAAGSMLGANQYNDNYSEVNFLYGRSFPLNEKIFNDGFVGAGYFYFDTYGLISSNSKKKGRIEESTIGFPSGAKLQFMLGPRYSMD